VEGRPQVGSAGGTVGNRLGRSAPAQQGPRRITRVQNAVHQ